MESFVVKQPRSGLASNPILGTEHAKTMINEPEPVSRVQIPAAPLVLFLYTDINGIQGPRCETFKLIARICKYSQDGFQFINVSSPPLNSAIVH